MAASYAMNMKMMTRIALASAVGLMMTGAASSPDAFARGPDRPGGRMGPGGEQDAARRAMLDGRVMPFSVIKKRMERKMGDATYLGSEFHTQSNRYRLKYVRDGRVVWVDVDGRTGDIAGWAH
ncbi:MAG: hypothetical protein AB7E05_08955 [Sphingobium sp.]